jgi:hypothetical protein
MTRAGAPGIDRETAVEHHALASLPAERCVRCAVSAPVRTHSRNESVLSVHPACNIVPMPVTRSSPDDPPDPPVRVVVAMPATMAAELRAVAHRHDRPVAAEVRQAVRAHLARAEHEPGEEAPQ